MMPCTGQWPAGLYTGFIAIASPALDKTAQLYNLTGGDTDPCSRHKLRVHICHLWSPVTTAGAFELGYLADRPGKVWVHRGPG